MEWIQPTLFWAMAGIAVPLGIHLWNGRKGKVIAWAATAWLDTKESQSSRSLKLEHWWLLLARIILWALLVLLAVGLWWKSLEQSGSPKIVHAVLSDPQVEAEFRFELEQALSRGEEVFWVAPGLPEYEIGDVSPGDFDPNQMQAYLDLLPKGLDSLHFYAAGLDSDWGDGLLWVQKAPVMNLATETANPSPSDRLIGLSSGDFLGLDESGVLQKISPESAPTSEKTASSGTVPFFLDVKDEQKKAEILASLAALEEVYGLSFEQADLPVAQVVFSDQPNETADSGKLNFPVGGSETSNETGHVSLASPASLPWEEVVEKGILPELILAPLIEFLGIVPTDVRLSQAQIAQKFVEIPKAKQAAAANTTEIMLVLIALCFALERFLAYRSRL